jgi:hypothetical protein
LIVVLSTGCINMHEPTEQAKYINCYNSFDSFLVDIIPKKIPNDYVRYGYASLKHLSGANKYAGMHLTTRISDLTEYSNLKNKFLEQAKTITSSLDTCLMVVQTYGRLEASVQGNFNCDKLVPVPQFGICVVNDSTHMWQRIKNADIIVLDFKFKDILNRPDSELRTDIPKELSTGYSKGVTLNKNDMTIQKWVIVW